MQAWKTAKHMVLEEDEISKDEEDNKDGGLTLSAFRMELNALDNEMRTTPYATIQKIISNQPYSIHHHRTLSEKQKLLHESVLTLDVNVVVVVCAFLHETMEPHQLFQELSRYPFAKRVYQGWLRKKRGIFNVGGNGEGVAEQSATVCAGKHV